MTSPTPDNDRTWRQHAACRDMDTNQFFPSEPEGVNQAKQVCAHCPVTAPCLQLALHVPVTADYGIFGGTTPAERRHLHRRRPNPAASPFVTDPARAQAAHRLAAKVGIYPAARQLGTTDTTLRRAWQRWGLPIPRRKPGGPPPTPFTADLGRARAAFQLAQRVGVRAAARQLGTTHAALTRAWDRWELGRPTRNGNHHKELR